MEAVAISALIISGVHLLFALGKYISGKTKNTVDDAVFKDTVESVVVEVIGRLFPAKVAK